MPARPLRVLTFTSIFPNGQQPLHGIFVSQRIQALSRLCDIRVVAPVPWAPPTRWLGDRYYRYSRVAPEENQCGLLVKHPKVFIPPKIGKAVDGMLMAAGCVSIVRELRRSFSFDVIDAHWAYPDGVAAAILARFLKVPLALTVRGDDINIMPQYFWRRQAIRWALRRAQLVIALSEDLKRSAESLSSISSKFVVVPNGIDPELFCPGDVREARHRLKIAPKGRILLSAGRLHMSKGYPVLVEALAKLLGEFPDLSVVIVGESDYEADARPAINAAAARLGVSDRVHLVGAQPHSTVVDWYRAADLFCLPTIREGSANVLLEAIACGLPCVSTPVGGNPDIISSSDVGLLVAPEIEPFTNAIAAGLRRSWDKERIAQHARRRTWDVVAADCYAHLSRLVNAPLEIAA